MSCFRGCPVLLFEKDSVGYLTEKEGQDRPERAVKEFLTNFKTASKICVCGPKRQIIDCQLSPISPRTRSGVPKPDACAISKFNALIVSIIANMGAQSDLPRFTKKEVENNRKYEEMPAVSMSAFPFGSLEAILGSPGHLG